MKEVKRLESAQEHWVKLNKDRVIKPEEKFRALHNYLALMFPTYELSINQEVTIVILTAPDDKDYVYINLDKEYMINSVSYYSNEVVDEDKD